MHLEHVYVTDICLGAQRYDYLISPHPGFRGKAVMKVQDSNISAVDNFAEFMVLGTGVRYTTNGLTSSMHPNGITCMDDNGKLHRRIVGCTIHST